MIAFDLQCDNGHVFEGWFDSCDAFDIQKKKGLVQCPLCNSDKVAKALTSFGIIKKNTPAALPGNQDEKRAMDHLVRKIYDFVEHNFDDVGGNFAKEALKIHYGVTEPRNIRGSSTQEEEKLLKEEGINVMKIPVPDNSDTDA